ncbi:MAG: hypothetical protein MJ246_03705 [Clostridia bacterium]|nr:hypothetical protein [Clostridia bacterium]
MIFTSMEEYIRANGMVNELPAERIISDLIETCNDNYKKGKEFFREILDYRRDLEILEAAQVISAPEKLLRSKMTLFDDCSMKVFNNGILFDDMSCTQVMDERTIKDYLWSAEAAVDAEWCIDVLNLLIDHGYDAEKLFEGKFKEARYRDDRLKEVSRMCKRHTGETIIDKKHKLERLGERVSTKVLSTLTRGELQSFLDDDKLFGCHLAIMGLEKEPLIDVTDEKMNEYLEDSKYGPYLKDLRGNFDFLTKKKLVRIQDQYTDEELNELVFEELAVTDLRIKNLIQILEEPNLAQRNKWLRENKRMPLTDDEKISGIKKEYSTANLRIDKILADLENETRKEFYESIGINYEDYDTNHDLPTPIKYGVEIEENGVEYYYNATGFQGHSDYSISGYSKRTHEFDSSTSGEYVSEIFKTDNKKQMGYLREQSRLLNLFGASTNTSCGFHVHCSDEHIQETVTERKALARYTEYKDYLDDQKQKGGSLFYYGINKEFVSMQNIIAKKLNIFSERTEGYARFLDENEEVPDMDARERFVNFCSLDKHGSIEFRFLNLPDAVDPKVMEAYIDFCTCYYSYLTEENFTEDYAKEAYEEVTGKSVMDLSDEEYEDLKFDILLEQLLVKDDTKKVIKHLDDIFEFYNVQNENGVDFDYFTGFDKTIAEENLEKQILDVVYQVAESEIYDEDEETEEEAL